ncbi:transcription-repair coupling factor, partial [candidate division KSB1 bacterium]
MLLKNDLKKFYGSGPFNECQKRVANKDHFEITGISGSSTAVLISALAQNTDEQLIVITPDYKWAEALSLDIEAISGEEINYFPSYRGLHLEDRQINSDIKLARLKCLQNLCLKKPGTYIIEVRSLLHPIVSYKSFKNRLLQIKAGEESDFNLLVNYLIEEGFTRESMVEDFGDISVRGGIIDIFPPAMLKPVRIEFDGDIVESIRLFDINTQRSLETIDNITIFPPTTEIKGGLAPHIPEKDNSILSYLSESAPLFFHQPVSAQKVVGEYCDRWNKDKNFISGHGFVDPRNIFDEINKSFESRNSAYLLNRLAAGDKKNVIDFNFRSLPYFGRDLKFFSQVFNDFHKDYPKLSITILCENDSQADRLRDLILDEDLLTAPYKITSGTLSEGFIYPEGQIALVNDHEIFSRKVFRKPKKVYKARKVIFDELSLKIGDFVVHEDFGIGRYLGLKKIQIGQSDQEVLKIEYKGGDTLFLNIDRLPLLQKYTGQEGFKPELSKLGGTDWDRIKKRTKKSVQIAAKDLVKLYSKRHTEKGYSFSPDTHWQRELEVSFQFEETPDQLKACWEIKTDMEKAKPMDRLVCGDVGFGKTEVALRAAFKAVNDSKQVAILVPTTILAQQHFETFSNRLEKYPINIEMLSRFRTSKKQKQIVEKLKDRSVDIVIGTHRLLSKDISFQDLGLIVIDEEQRFGVANKEKLKQLRTQVDVLTMTATPIPRTMHMSILGVRDLSVINTPPINRLPIITEISEYDDDLVRAAIIKEMDRGGQVYFVHNRVRTINKMLRSLEKIVPEATFGIAHGQMKERELEDIMISFTRGDFSCLISTMIIESGLDIPNVNTIIVNQANNFGLAQLYQLRGRVGRSDAQAFAYLLTSPFEKMTDESIKRLETLSEHTELGSGLQIAMKDLEIRGAGNLLGVEQSGRINEVGFDMYMRLVKECVSEEMKDVIPEEVAEENGKNVSDVKIDTDLAAYIPEYFIPDSFQRVSFYRQISLVKNKNDLDEIGDTLKDRYGRIPVETNNLLML